MLWLGNDSLSTIDNWEVELSTELWGPVAGPVSAEPPLCQKGFGLYRILPITSIKHNSNTAPICVQSSGKLVPVGDYEWTLSMRIRLHERGTSSSSSPERQFTFSCHESWPRNRESCWANLWWQALTLFELRTHVGPKNEPFPVCLAGPMSNTESESKPLLLLASVDVPAHEVRMDLNFWCKDLRHKPKSVLHWPNPDVAAKFAPKLAGVPDCNTWAEFLWLLSLNPTGLEKSCQARMVSIRRTAVSVAKPRSSM